MFADGLLCSRDGLLWKNCICEQLYRHFGSDKRVISTMPPFALLPNVMESYRCPDGWKVAAFACRNRICDGHHTLQVIEVMCGVLTALASHSFSGQLKNPVLKVIHPNLSLFSLRAPRYPSRPAWGGQARVAVPIERAMVL